MDTSQKLKLLLLDDNPIDAELIRGSLDRARLDYTSAYAADKEEFFRLVESFRPDMILSDFGLVQYDGLRAYYDLRALGNSCPFILVTGSLPDDVAVECLKAGMDDYILKDRLSRLPEAISQVLKKRELEEENQRAYRNLVLNKRRLQAAEKMAQVGNWELDVVGGTVEWSAQMYEIVGTTPQAYRPSIGSFLELIHPDDHKGAKEMSISILKGITTTTEGQVRLNCLNGETKMVHFIYNSNGQSPDSGRMKVFGTMQDITKQYLTEKALRELTAQLEERVLARTSELSKAKSQLETRNQEMVDSISYAQLLQKAILSDDSRFKVQFANSFILLMPKDIVSGDFYWFYNDGDQSYVAAVDCTGHGVPGALMSVLAQQLLNGIVREGFREPAEILTELDRRVSGSLSLNDGQVLQDGMDMALCRIDKKERRVCFAGAMRPLFIYHDGEVDELSGSRLAIGNRKSLKEASVYEQICVMCQPTDTIYLTSDGIYSQFGGPFGKKLMKNRFKSILADSAKLEIHRQSRFIADRLTEWKGDEEQVDDIIVLGIQL